MPRDGVICAVDPGLSIGFAVFDLYSVVAARTEGYITDTLTEPKDLWEALLTIEPEIVVCETFQTGGRISADGLATVRIVGGVEALCHVIGSTYQGKLPVARRGRMSAAKEFLQKYQPTHTNHQQDALAHLLAYQEFRREREWL